MNAFERYFAFKKAVEAACAVLRERSHRGIETPNEHAKAVADAAVVVDAQLRGGL